MITLHAGVWDGAMAFWGESSGGDPAPKPSRKKRARGRRHPYSASAQEIKDGLKSQLGPRLSRSPTDLGIWLPSYGGKPLPSDGIGPGPSGPNSGISLMRWHVDTVMPETKDAVRILSEVIRSRTSISGMSVGPDLAYWADVLRLAGSMVARQQILPGMEKGHARYRGVWRPVFMGRDDERFAALARRMPAAGYAFESASPRIKPVRSPAAVLRTVITGFVDHMVRSTASAAVSGGYARRKHFDSIHDSWLHGLMTADDTMEDSADASALEASIVEWKRTITALANPSLRLCFRLEEPGDSNSKSGGPWFVRYLLQSRNDPSLIIAADRVWNGKGIPALGRDGRHAKEFLLASLGRASGIVTGMSEGLEKYGMAGYAVDAAGAHRFLSEEASVLEQLGYGIMLPSWWVGGGTKARLTARAVAAPKMKAGGMLDIDSVVRFDWELAVGGKKITLKELQRLADAKSPLVSIRGQWMEIGSGEIKRAIDFLRKNARMTVRDSVMMEFGAGRAPGWMELEVSGKDGRITDMMGMLRGDAEIRELPQPDGFAGKLRPYQLRGYSWLAFLQGIGLGGCLADDMGLGKTVQILALAQRYRQARKKGPILLVCPTSVMDNWSREAARFAPDLSVAIHHGGGRKRDGRFARDASGHDIIVSSYGLMYRDIQFIKKVRWGGVVLDEAQNIKNPETKQSKAARSLDAGFRFALTGTPVENSVGDIWSIMEFLNPGLLGTQAEFKRNFFVPIQLSRDRRASETLKRITGPFMLRRLKTDRTVITDLPKKMEMNVYCSLTREQASLYAAVLKNVGDELGAAEGIRRKGLILAILTKLKQVCNHPAHFLKDGSAIADRSGKLARLTEMLDEVISSGERALVFTQFVEMGELLRRHIADTFGREVPFLHGGVPKRRRDAMVERFQDGGSDVFVVSLKAGGTGLNLTAASHVFHFDRWWNPAVENQATDRAFRIGQRRNVQVHKLICAGTMEERIDEIINRKKEISEGVVGTGEGWLTKMSDGELREVLALSREATRL